MGIVVKNITKTFGKFTALRNVSLSVETGELVALLGPSGSGKTTLLRIIAGLEQPDNDDASILFHQEDVAGRPVHDRRVGFVFQHYALFRHMSVFENIAFGLQVRPKRLRPPKSEIRNKVYELLRLIQLEAMAGRYPHQLSGGQRQRVALARALAIEPSVLLLDEPFGALDAKVRQELRRWLRKLHREINVTSIFVTHDQEEALEVASRVVVMNTGRIEQIGTPDEVFHNPKTEFVMGFLGQVNRFRGRLENGIVYFAGISQNAPEHEGRSLRDVMVFVRPHELEVEKGTEDSGAMRARVVYTRSAGTTARLELTADTNETFQAEISLDQFHSLNIASGDVVRVRPKKIRIFPADSTTTDGEHAVAAQ